MADLNVGRFEGSERSRERSRRRVNGAGGFEKGAGLKTRHYNDREKIAGLEPHTYKGEEKKCGGKRN